MASTKLYFLYLAAATYYLLAAFNHLFLWHVSLEKGVLLCLKSILRSVHKNDQIARASNRDDKIYFVKTKFLCQTRTNGNHFL